MQEEESENMESAKSIFAAIIGIFFVLDVALAGGHLIVKPAINMIIFQSLDGTFWKCKDWVIMDEGQFCGDEN